MRQSVHLILCIIVGIFFYLVFEYFVFSAWLFVIFVPALIYVMILATNLYSFRISLDFEEIPRRGYGLRIRELEQNARALFNLGFRKFDEFYWRIATDAVVYAYLHESRVTVLCDYHLGAVTCCDLVTNFDSGYSLTTSSTASAGNIKRSKKKLLQIFHQRPFEELFWQHRQAVEFLSQKGLRVQHWRPEEFRREFLKVFLSERRNTVTLVAPFKLLFWMLTNYKARHMKPIRQQFLAKTLELP